MNPRDVIAEALAAHHDTFEDATELPTEYHGYADAVLEAFADNGIVMMLPAVEDDD